VALIHRNIVGRLFVVQQESKEIKNAEGAFAIVCLDF